MPRTSQQIRDEIESAKVTIKNAKANYCAHREDREIAVRGMRDSERRIDRLTSTILVLKQILPKAVARERAAAKRAREAEKSMAKRTRAAEKQAAKSVSKKPSKKAMSHVGEEE